MNAITQNEVSAINLTQRAAVALGSSEHETKLRELVKASADIVAVIDPAGREQAHRIAMNLRTARTTIEKVGKAARDDATKFSKAVIAEEARLVAIIEPEESRVLALRDTFDAAIEAEKQAKIAAERMRVEAIHAAIASIREKAFSANGHKSSVIAKLREEVAEAPIAPDVFAEFLPQAMEAVAQTLAKLDQMIAEAEANEAADAESARLAALEVARVAAERSELEAQRAEQERIANEQAKVARELAAQQAAIEAAAKQQREAAEANIRAERAAADAEIKAAQAKFNEELAAFELAKRIEADHAEAIAIDIERTDSLAKYAALRTPESILDAVDAGEISIADVSPTDAEIVDVYVEHFGGTRDEAVARLINFTGDEV